MSFNIYFQSNTCTISIPELKTNSTKNYIYDPRLKKNRNVDILNDAFPCTSHTTSDNHSSRENMDSDNEIGKKRKENKIVEVRKLDTFRITFHNPPHHRFPTRFSPLWVTSVNKIRRKTQGNKASIRLIPQGYVRLILW